MVFIQSTFATLLLAVGAQSAIIGDTPWDTLNTTFIFGGGGFMGVPLTASEAITKGWTQILTCEDEGSPGDVYWFKGNYSAMPIYNADGNTAGIIIGVEDPGPSQYGKNSWIKYTYTYGTNNQLNGTFYGIQGIWRDPEYICTAGSTGNVTFGDRLWIASDSYDSYFKIPLTEEYCDLLDLGFDQGGCKDGAFRMGVHYWRNVSLDINCNNSYPVFLLYDNHTLHAWGVAMGNTDRPYINETRWEHPPGAFLTSFFLNGDCPTCITSQSKWFNSLHVFMTSSVIASDTSATDCSIETVILDNGTTLSGQRNCSSSSSSSGGKNKNNDDSTGIIIGVVVGIVVLICIVGVVVWRCRSTSDPDSYVSYN